MKKLVCLFLFACKPAPQPVVEPEDPGINVQLRVVNLSRDVATVQMEGEDKAHAIAPLGTHHQVGRVAPTMQHGTITAQNVLMDGGKQAATFAIDFDPTVEPSLTFVIKDQTPARLSTNMTVAKQTQGATFGEKVAAGLAGVQYDDGIDTGGDCGADVGTQFGTVGFRLREDNSCDDNGTPWYARPSSVPSNATPYLVRGSESPLLVYWLGELSSNDAGALVGGALPGGSIVSAAVSSMYVLNAHPGHENALLRIKGGATLAENVAPGAIAKLSNAAMSKLLTGGNEVELVVGASVQTITFSSTYTGPCRPPYLCDFLFDQDLLVVGSSNMTESNNVIKTSHDSLKGAIANVRRTIALHTTNTSVDTSACVEAVPGDTECVLGAAKVAAGLQSGASALAQGARYLFPPKPVLGSQATLHVREGATAFTWKVGNPISDPTQGGIALVTPGEALGGASDKRGIIFVNMTTTPWTATSALSN